jgi:hypothetical protein
MTSSIQGKKRVAKSNAVNGPNEAESVNGERVVTEINGKTYFRDEVIAEMNLGPCPSGMILEHIDGNLLNCHCSNLCYVPATAQSKSQ